MIMLVINFIFCSSAAAATGIPISFAFFDSTGHKLLMPTIATIETVDAYQWAVVETNKLLTLRFEGFQDLGTANSSRQTAKSFQKISGYVWSVDGDGSHNKSAMLIDKSFFDEHTFPAVTLLPEECSPAEKKIIEQIRKRLLAKSWGILEREDGTRLFLLLFEPQGNDVLASIAAISSNNTIFLDYPATYNKVSTWRVDDGGEIGPEQFKILYFGKSRQGSEMVIEFLGAEGSLIESVVEKGGYFERGEPYCRSTRAFERHRDAEGPRSSARGHQ